MSSSELSQYCADQRVKPVPELFEYPHHISTLHYPGNPHDDTLTAINRACELLDHESGEKVRLADRPFPGHNESPNAALGIIRTLIDTSLERVIDAPAETVLPTRGRGHASACGMLEPFGAKTLLIMAAGRDIPATIVVGAETGQPLMVRYERTESAALTLVPTVVAGVQYPAGMVASAKFVGEESRPRPKAIDIVSSTAVRNVSMMRPTIWALPPAERAQRIGRIGKISFGSIGWRAYCHNSSTAQELLNDGTIQDLRNLISVSPSPC